MVSFKQKQGFPEYAHRADCIKITLLFVIGERLSLVISWNRSN